ncbi:zinc finger protein 500 [Anguilla rostrata]|uniref:zinc finger protein 500 n=1 Tax=Anguilla rostrata TaxID=7938 RepID=UPI0030CEC384
MSDAIRTFQSQLSGVMETVFKAAMYEITRLVEDSFLEEVSRSREQVESLKQRLQWSENRRRERESGGRTRCVDCGRVGVSNEETEVRPSGTLSDVDEGRGLKQEKVPEGSWSSCPGEGSNPGPPHAQEAVATPSPIAAPSGCTPTASDLDGDGLDAMLKEEALQTAPPAGGLQERWAVCLEGQEGPEGGEQDRDFGAQRLHMCEEEWGSEAGPEAGPGREGGGEELAHAYEARYGMEEELGVALEAESKGEYMAAMLGDRGLEDTLAFPPELDPANGPAHPLVPRARRAGFPLPVDGDAGELDCLLINEDGFLQDADRRQRGARRGRGRSRAELPVPDIAQDRHRGEPFALLPPAGAERPHGCSLCPMSFPEPAALKAHLQAHGGAPYTCTQCGKGFTQACNLKVHQRVHSGQGLHLCSHCGKAFGSFADLKRHKCSHGSEKPYCCSLCGNRFSRLWNLKLHRRIHTQEKPHRCAQCGKSFTRADILKVHQRTHTGERPYCCAVCGLSFKRLDHLKSHQRKHS